MKIKIKVIILSIVAIMISNYAIANNDTSKKIIPAILMLLDDNPMNIVEGAWQGVEIASTTDAANQDQQDLKLVMNDAGNGWITWRQQDGTNPNKYSIWVNSYNSETGWGVAENIETLDYEAEEPTIAINSSGEAMVVWAYRVEAQNNVDVWQLWESHLESDLSTWTTPISIFVGPDDFTHPRVPQLSMDDSGQALLVWHLQNINGSSGFELISSNYDPDTNLWSAAEELSTTALASTPPTLVMNNNGQALAVWREQITILVNGFGVTRPVVKGSVFDPVTGWGLNETISFADETTATNGSITPQAAIDASGNAVVVWVHNKNLLNFESEFNVWARHYSVNSGWGTQVLLETSESKYAIAPQVAMNDSGDAVAIWFERIGDIASGVKSIWANNFSANSGWAGAEEIGSPSATQNTIPEPKVGLDDNGNATAVWLYQQSSVNNIETSRFDNQTNTWGSIDTIGTETSNTENPLLVTNGLGRSLVVWSVNDFFGDKSLKSNYYK